MAIVRKNKEEQTEMSGSKKVGKANSKEVKKKERGTLVMDGVILQLDKEGKPVAPKANTDKKKENLADMIKNAKRGDKNE